MASLLPQRKCVVRGPWSVRGCNTTSTKYTYSMAFEFCMHVCMTSQKEMIVCLHNCGVGLTAFCMYLGFITKTSVALEIGKLVQAGISYSLSLSLSLSFSSLLFSCFPLLLLSLHLLLLPLLPSSSSFPSTSFSYLLLFLLPLLPSSFSPLLPTPPRPIPMLTSSYSTSAVC